MSALLLLLPAALQPPVPVPLETATPGLLSAEQIAAMRACILASLPEVATWWRAVRRPDGAGGSIVEYANGGLLLCRLERGQAFDERPAASRMEATSSCSLYLPAGTRAAASDRLEVLGALLEVTSLFPSTTEELFVVVVCRDIV